LVSVRVYQLNLVNYNITGKEFLILSMKIIIIKHRIALQDIINQYTFEEDKSRI